MNLYRSGRMFRPPLANKGHSFVLTPPPEGWEADPESFPETPAVFRCTACHLLATGWAISERWIDGPCMGSVAPLPAGYAATLFDLRP